MVRYVGDAAVADTVKAHHPEVVGEGRVQAWVVGSGGGDSAGEELGRRWRTASPWSSTRTRSSTSSRARPRSLTPHAGELAAMLGEDRQDIESRPLHFAREAARKYDATVLLKGRRTVIARPDGKTRVNTTGTAWLATAGAGDVLGGVIGGAAGRRPHGVRRRQRRRLAARRGRDARLATAARSSPPTSPGGCPRSSARSLS